MGLLVGQHRRLRRLCRKGVSAGQVATTEFRAPTPSNSVALWITETETRRDAAELRLQRLNTDRGMTAEEIRGGVERMQGIAAILDSASPDDRKRVYEAAQLTITYDHENRRAKLSVAPEPEPWSYERVGGGT